MYKINLSVSSRELFLLSSAVCSSLSSKYRILDLYDADNLPDCFGGLCSDVDFLERLFRALDPSRQESSSVLEVISDEC